MRTIPTLLRVILCLTLAQCVVGLSISASLAQSQESKPGRETATPPAAEATPVDTRTSSGLGDGEWQSPIWDIRVAWDPGIWSVENEVVESPYEGLQLGSDSSTVYIEAYEGFNGSAEECLAAAEQEIADRTNTREVTRLSGRPLPELAKEEFASELFGVIAELPDGSIYRGAEYVACRSLEPGAAVLEMAWQTATSAYNDELPHVSELFASVTVPEGQVS